MDDDEDETPIVYYNHGILGILILEDILILAFESNTPTPPFSCTRNVSSMLVEDLIVKSLCPIRHCL